MEDANEHHEHQHSGDEDDQSEQVVGRTSNEGFLDDIADDITDLDLSHERLVTFVGLGLERFKLLERLSVRQNLIFKIECLEGLGLKELDLYDNRIVDVDGLEHLKETLVSLDLSFNKIRHIHGVNKLTALTDLYFVANKISKIENLVGLSNVTNLELGANRIRVIEGLDTLVSIEQLWLGKNKIRRLENLNSLTNLKILSMQSNRIVRLENLEHLVNLEELYLGHNGVSKIENLEHNTRLRVLDLSSNTVKVLEGLEKLMELEEVWLSGNQLESYDEIERQLTDKKKLTTVYFEQNPLHLNNRATYRNKVRLILPWLEQIDGDIIRRPAA
ncbi:uncharacterized protein BJ171DRAFT_494394 [Polychytrium aggregatum]|uniref:uncharacterized protein n=1 Tax=Polychytrium aggregatum TaxID=110093 RepID=UPI0022FDF8A7|nr:uncharacterized protein BJ171DRAFT_494394 [Polychytrium aggregatum]KAI9207357.1 hypothetical protein BJ171DRAFT_494394 [Polychytrium aggregatum]